MARNVKKEESQKLGRGSKIIWSRVVQLNFIAGHQNLTNLFCGPPFYLGSHRHMLINAKHNSI